MLCVVSSVKCGVWVWGVGKVSGVGCVGGRDGDHIVNKKK